MSSSTTPPIKGLETLPVLPSHNFDETISFYCGKLGFENLGRWDDYLILKFIPGGIEIHFWLTDNKELPKNSSCYVRGEGIEELYLLWKDLGIERLCKPVQREFGMTEMYVIDVHGNLIKFGYRTVPRSDSTTTA